MWILKRERIYNCFERVPKEKSGNVTKVKVSLTQRVMNQRENKAFHNLNYLTSIPTQPVSQPDDRTFR
jgi:hypothetical protein